MVNVFSVNPSQHLKRNLRIFSSMIRHKAPKELKIQTTTQSIDHHMHFTPPLNHCLSASHTPLNNSHNRCGEPN
uniref:Uncharacterized protein n=1 Tax=Manihot esculenta TaxID=3983 RepID=A0A2C9WGR9_MANES